MNGINSPAVGGARSLGFQPALSPAERSHFVAFSENTKGRSGRPVYIDARLLAQFLCLIDVDNEKGRRIIRGIEGLRSIGGGISSYQSTSRPARHMSLLEDLEVYYFIEQLNANGMPAGLFITALKKHFGPSSHKANVYLIDQSRTTPTNNTFFSLNNASISSASSLEQSIFETEQHAPRNGWNALEAREILFVPGKLNNAAGNWLCPMEKQQSPSDLETKISAVLDTTQKRQQALKKGETIKVQIHRDSVNLVAAALAKSSGHLDALDFQFIEPMGNLSNALTLVKSRNAQSTQPIVATTKSSLIALAQVKFQLEQLLAHPGATKASTDLPRSLAPTAAALNASRPGLKSADFINSVKQANKLGNWSKQ